ncbi:hypothetical protein PPYR_13933 [Photinus pyralis]|uniref:Cilia- and flagella-associated protein 91 n=3 Tax=Photinus pyralis TaxID=7054 RepID=A0A5N4A3U6_PHOPY|nr:cilia- and flagella-associated protein 91-like [Photinus pyralis]KAB0791972.1 hypothetical protein PPYR_13933 [Photinus pyralis]
MTKLTRPNDYLYDPLFTVSGERDYYKAAMAAKMSSAKYAICPIFPSMFSDLPHQPRQMIVLRKTGSIPQFKPQVEFRKSVDIIGVDRFKFFQTPIPLSISPVLTTPRLTFSPLISAQKPARKRHKMIQTQYRESSAQTIPWQPSSYTITDDSHPELLMLDFLKWGCGLPAGMHEVRLIERARMKRAWENSLPPATDDASIEKMRAMTEAIERDEWAFREQEIQDIQDLRLQLLVRMLNELHAKSHIRTEMKLKSFCKTKMAEKEEKLQKLHRDGNRALRKLEMRHRGIKQSYHPVDIIEECADRKSEMYAPLMRHGEHPWNWHQVIDDHDRKYQAQFLGVEDVGTLPRWLDDATAIRESSIHLPGTRLCIRETKWTSPVLKELYDELKHLRKKERQKCSLKVKVDEQEIPEAQTPQVAEGDDGEEQLHQSVILMERVLRGRASQVLIFEGRDRCRELIQELRSTHALQEHEREKVLREKLEVESRQRAYELCVKNARMLKESLSKLSGGVVGTLLDFLNKEQRRLLDERRIHAMCLAFERERNAREAAEGGRRQAEIRRRAEHDEIFKQVAKVTQDTVDLYLEDIITEGMEFASKTEASNYVRRLAQKIDNEVRSHEDQSTYEEKEELVASLVHHFLLPEAEKELVRDKIRKKQHNRLKAAHDTIYSQYDRLPKAEPKPISVEENVSYKTEDTLSSVSEIIHQQTTDNSSSQVTVIYSATRAGHSNFEMLSEIHSVMESLIDKEDISSNITIGSSGVPVKCAETNLDMKTLEMPIGVSEEIVKESKSFLLNSP